MTRDTRRSRGRAHGAAHSTTALIPVRNPMAARNRRSAMRSSNNRGSSSTRGRLVSEGGGRRMASLVRHPGVGWGAVIALVGGLVIPATSAQANVTVNVDVIQSWVQPQTDFHLNIRNDYTKCCPVGASYKPAGWSYNGRAYNVQTNLTTYSFSGPAIAQGTPAHFGVQINDVGNVPEPPTWSWTPGACLRVGCRGDLPGAWVGSSYAGISQTTTVILRNNGSDPFALSEVGWLAFSSPQALEDLNRTTMPPSSFNPAGIPDGTVLQPADQVMFTIAGLASDQFLVIYHTAEFVSPTSDMYTGQAGFWIEAPVSTPPTPVLKRTFGRLKMLYR